MVQPYLSIAVERWMHVRAGEVQLVVSVTSRPVVRLTADGGRVDDSRPHTVVLRADSTHATLQLDGHRQRSVTTASHRHTDTITSSSLHLGSLVDTSSAADVARPYLSPSAFVGCIQVRYGVYTLCDRNLVRFSPVTPEFTAGVPRYGVSLTTIAKGRHR